MDGWLFGIGFMEQILNFKNNQLTEIDISEFIPQAPQENLFQTRNQKHLNRILSIVQYYKKLCYEY